MRIPLSMLLAILLIAPACTRNEPSSTRAASEDRADVNDQLKRERDDYVTTMNARLAEFDQKVDGLGERADAMKGPTKDKFNNAITQLRDQRKAVADKLDNVKSVNVESWQTMRSDVDAAMADLDRAYEQVSNTYEKGKATGAPAGKTY